MFDAVQRPLQCLVLVLSEEELLAEQFEGQVLVAHVALVDLLLDHDFSLEFQVHVYLHGFQLVRLMLLWFAHTRLSNGIPWPLG